MDIAAQTNLSFSFGVEQEYFVPEIVFDNADAHRCTRAIYAPHLVVAENQTLPKHLEVAAWESYNETLSGRSEGDANNEIIYVSGGDDDGTPTVFETAELKLIRYGCQIVRVYGPQRIVAWEKNILGHMVQKNIDLSAQEKLFCFNHLNQNAEILELAYHVRYQSIDTHAQRAGHFNFHNFGEYKNGRFNQQARQRNNGEVAVYKTTFTFGQQKINKTFQIIGNSNIYKGPQVQKIGRKEQIIRETLTFSGEERKTIKYWYDNPIVTVLSWTSFVDSTGEVLDYRPHNAPIGSLRDYKAQRGKDFIADRKCWGSLLVEYKTSYTEFSVLYDFPNPRRQYEVLAGPIEKVGYQTFDSKDGTEGKILDKSNYLKGNNIGYDKILDDKDSTVTPPPKVAVKLFKQIQYKPFSTLPIELFYTNGRQSVAAQFTPPEPEFMDLPLDELPKITVYEKRVRERLQGGAEVDHIEEFTSVDVMGRIQKEMMEQRT